MNSESLKTFLIIAELKSYTKAAQRMFITQSTVTKRIKELENDLGRALFKQDKRHIELTAEGQILLKNAKEILALEERTISEIKQYEKRYLSLNVGCVNSLMECHVSECLAEFCKKYSDISLKLFVNHSHDLLNQLSDGEIDVCFSYHYFVDNNYDCIPFYEDELIFVTGGDNNPYPDGMTDEEIKKVPLCKGNLRRVAELNWFEKLYNLQQSHHVEAGQVKHLIPFLKQGFGYGFVIRKCAEKELNSGELTEITLLEHSTVHLQSYLIYRKTLDEAKQLLVSYVIDTLKNKT